MGLKARRTRTRPSARRESSAVGNEEQARKELVKLASEKLERPLTRTELEEIRHLGGLYLVSGYYAELYRGYQPRALLDWFSTVAETRKELNAIQKSRDAITASQVQEA